MKVKLRQSVAVMLTFILVSSLFAPMVSAEEDDVDLVTPIEIEERPHESNYDKYSALLDEGLDERRPTEAGALQLVVDAETGYTTLADQDGEPIQLRGMSTHGLQWFGDIINENAFSALANDWGSNVIRLALYIGENGYAYNPDLIEKVYEGIELAKKNDMYVIVDWHVHAPGNPNADIYQGGVNEDGEEYLGAKDFFLHIAEKYPNDPHVIYELANEPSSNSSGGDGVTNDEDGWEAVRGYAQPIVDALRESGNADDNIIIVGSPNWSQRMDLAADNPIVDHHTMYTLHFYTGSHHGTNDRYPEGTSSEDRSNVMANAKYALDKGKAIFATEWGVSEADGNNGPYLNEADVWLNFLNESNISWTNWSLTNKNETSGAFTPFILNESDATELDPGEDQAWSMEELSVSGEYVRSRILGEEYHPIDRTPREEFSEVIWDFNDGTTQGFGVNADSPVQVTLANENDALQISGLDESNDVGTEGETYWGNVRLSADEWDGSVDVLGAENITMDVIVDSPTTVAITAIPQSEKYGWANPENNAVVNPVDFEEQEDGTYKALLTITGEDAPNLANIAEDPEDSELTNIILFVGTEDADVISLDNITVTGDRESVPEPVEHDALGEATFPSDFEDGTRQGWEWDGESGVRTALTIEEVNGSNALSWEYAYPEVKPSDNWATAPRLTLHNDNLVRGDNEFLAFDFYIDPIEGRTTEGSIDINLVFQPPSEGYWAQASETFEIDLEAFDTATVTEDGLYHFEVEINFEDIPSDIDLRNIMLIFADVESDFAGRVYLDNVRFDGPESDSEDGEVTKPVDERQSVVEAKTTVTDNRATVSTDDVKKVAENGTLHVNLSATNATELSLTSEQVQQLRETNAKISVSKENVVVNIPFSLFTNDKEIVFTVEESTNSELVNVDHTLSSIYDFNLTQGGKKIEYFEGGIELSFTVDSSKVKNPENVKVFYWNEEEKVWELIGGTYEDGVVTVTVEHFSIFTVFEASAEELSDDDFVPGTEEEHQTSQEEKESDRLPDTATNTFNYLIMGMLLFVSGFAFFIIQRKTASKN